MFLQELPTPLLRSVCAENAIATIVKNRHPDFV